SERLDAAAARLAQVPKLLADAEAVLHATPRAWCERARRECAGARLLLSDGLPRLLGELGFEHAELTPAAVRAMDAFARFDAFIDGTSLPSATDTYACGEEAFDLVLRRAHFLDVDAPGLERAAMERIAEEQGALDAGPPTDARDVGGDTNESGEDR